MKAGVRSWKSASRCGRGGNHNRNYAHRLLRCVNTNPKQSGATSRTGRSFRDSGRQAVARSYKSPAAQPPPKPSPTPPANERKRFVEHCGIRSHLHVVHGDEGQRDTVIGHPCADALSGWRQPPVLDVALSELPRRCPQQMLARGFGLGYAQRHHVLQLIAKGTAATLAGVVILRPCRASRIAASENIGMRAQ